MKPQQRADALAIRTGIPRYDIFEADLGLFLIEQDRIETPPNVPLALREHESKTRSQFLQEITALLNRGDGAGTR